MKWVQQLECRQALEFLNSREASPTAVPSKQPITDASFTAKMYPACQGRQSRTARRLRRLLRDE
jgi:hypothetical protein